MSAMVPRFIAACLAVVFACNLSAAQEPTGRAADIKAILQRISGSDPVDRVVAVQEALGSEDPVVRSIVLERALSSDDRRVRAVGFAFLVSTNKRLIVEVEIPTKDLDELKEARNPLHQAFERARTQDMRIESYDKSKGQFIGVSSSLGHITGAVGQDGVTIIYYNNCKLTFPSASGGYLVGSFTCGSSSYLAKAALP